MAPAASVGPSMPSVPMLAAATCAPSASERLRHRERELLVASALPARDGDSRLARRNHAERARQRGDRRGRFARRAPRGIARLAGHRLANDVHVVAERLGSAPRRLDRAALRANHAATARASRGSPLAGVSGTVPAAPRCETIDDRRRIERATAAPVRDLERAGERAVVGTVGPTRSPTDRRRRRRTRASVSTRAARRGRELAALDRRQMLADGVELVDVCALLHQRPRGVLLVLECECRRRAAPSAPSRRLRAARRADRVRADARAISSARRAAATLPSSAADGRRHAISVAAGSVTDVPDRDEARWPSNSSERNNAMRRQMP